MRAGLSFALYRPSCRNSICVRVINPDSHHKRGGSLNGPLTALDWTDFGDDQSIIVLSMSHSRATPLLWNTAIKPGLKGWRNEHEDVLLEFREVLPEGEKVTVFADRPTAACTSCRASS